MNANFLKDQLLKRQQDHLYRELPKPAKLIDFASNDYLGLARSESLYKEIQENYQKHFHASGATGSRLLTGNNQLVEDLEGNLAMYFEGEKCLVFNSGYTANLSVLSCVPQKGDTIIYDERSHACIKDGARLSFANRYSFHHNDLEDLKNKLAKSEGKKFVVVESVYSMDGDTSPLRELVELSKKIEFHLVVDEAHATGLGNNGRGLTNDLGLCDDTFARIYTFGKAVGVHGACVAGSKDLINYLINYARPFIYTTAMPDHSLISIQAALNHIKNSPGLKVSLEFNIQLFKKMYCGDGLIESTTPIQALVIPGNEKIKNLARQIQQKGFDVRAILSPTVTQGSERFRICLHSFNTEEEITGLCDVLNGVYL